MLINLPIQMKWTHSSKGIIYQNSLKKKQLNSPIFIKFFLIKKKSLTKKTTDPDYFAGKFYQVFKEKNRFNSDFSKKQKRRE